MNTKALCRIGGIAYALCFIPLGLAVGLGLLAMVVWLRIELPTWLAGTCVIVGLPVMCWGVWTLYLDGYHGCMRRKGMLR